MAVSMPSRRESMPSSSNASILPDEYLWAYIRDVDFNFLGNDTKVETTSSSKSIHVKKRQRKRYLVNQFPRIIKSDIRRFYPRMLANIANSLDPCLIKSFMQTYCLPQFSSVDILPDELISQAPGIQSTCTIEGLDTSVIYFLFLFELMPDLAVLLKNSSIKQFREDPTHSEIIITMEFRGTKSFDIVPCFDNTDHEMATMAKEMDAFFNAFRFLSTSTDAILDEVSTVCGRCAELPALHKKLSSHPFFLNTICQLRICLDANNRFCRMEISYPYYNP